MPYGQNNDALLSAVGSALSLWSFVELRLSSLFSTISGLEDEKKAHIMFAAVVSFEARLAMCDRLMELEDQPDLEKEMWNKFSARMSKFYKKRHALAHFS